MIQSSKQGDSLSNWKIQRRVHGGLAFKMNLKKDQWRQWVEEKTQDRA